jgi:hypothetical protein
MYLSSPPSYHPPPTPRTMQVRVRTKRSLEQS